MSREAFEKDIYSNVSHSITSENILVEKETGRVVAVFYNDYDLDSVVEQLAQAPVVAEGYVLMPIELTVENGAKGLLIGEFSINNWIECGHCEDGTDFDGIDCDSCDGQGGYHHRSDIDWPTIKDIYKMAVDGLILKESKS